MGSTSKRLSKLLASLGYSVQQFVIPSGHYRTSRYADCLRWEADALTSEGFLVHLGSWDTMTDCLKRGVTIHRPKHYADAQLMVSAKDGGSDGRLIPEDDD